MKGQMFSDTYLLLYSLDFRCIYVQMKDEGIDLKVGTLILLDHKQIKGLGSKTILNLGNFNDVEEMLYSQEDEN